MARKAERAVKSELQLIPGVGADMEQHLRAIGIEKLADLRGRSPEELYRLDEQVQGQRSDLCVLYVFRLAVYFAENEEHQPEKLRWWYWKDKVYSPEPAKCAGGGEKQREQAIK